VAHGKFGRTKLFIARHCLSKGELPRRRERRSWPASRTSATAMIPARHTNLLFGGMRLCIPVAVLLAVSAPISVWANQTAGDAQANRQVVTAAFERWAAGGTGFYQDILWPDASWTIMGSGWAARTYGSRAELIARAVRPVTERLKVPIKPAVTKVWTEDNAVIVLWSGVGITCNDTTYKNDYVWIFYMQNKKAMRATAFLDLAAYYELIKQVRPEQCSPGPFSSNYWVPRASS